MSCRLTTTNPNFICNRFYSKGLVQWEDGECYEDRSSKNCAELHALSFKESRQELGPITLKADQNMTDLDLTDLFVIGCDLNAIK